MEESDESGESGRERTSDVVEECDGRVWCRVEESDTNGVDEHIREWKRVSNVVSLRSTVVKSGRVRYTTGCPE